MNNDRTETLAERIAKKHGARHCRLGSWNRAFGMKDKAAAERCAEDLRAVHYQIRNIIAEKNGLWEVIFR